MAEELLQKDCPGYRCHAFRAGGWCIQPSHGVVNALLDSGFRIDSTVAPGLANETSSEWSDFRKAPALACWQTTGDVCVQNEPGTTRSEEREPALWEVPITVGRIGRLRHYQAVNQSRTSGEGGMAPGCRGDYSGPDSRWQVLRGKLGKVSRLGKAMLDFSTMPADVLIEISEQWIERFAGTGKPIPLVAIAHTKNFTTLSEANLLAYLDWAAAKGIRFSTYGQWLEACGE